MDPPQVRGAIYWVKRTYFLKWISQCSRNILGAPRPGGKIVGGFPINITQVPWQVAISDGYYQICGGSIISDRWILTAAHCLYGVDELPYIVLTGTTDKEKGDQRFTVDKYIIHENYISNTNDYDFGLLRLSEKLTFSDVARAVQMPKVDDEDIANGTPCLISGWGTTQNQSESSRYLRAVEVPKVDQDLCNKAYSGRVTPRMFCAGLYEVGGKYGKCLLAL